MRLIFELFLTFLKIGTFTFGGGLAMLPLIRKIVVEEKGWMSEEEIADCFAVSQSLPGVLAVNAAIYIGNKSARLGGGLASAAGVILPAFVSILIILIFLGKIENNIYVRGAFEGIKAASAALISVAAYNMGRTILTGRLQYFIAIGAFVLIVFAGINAIWVVVFSGIFGLTSQIYKQRKGART